MRCANSEDSRLTAWLLAGFDAAALALAVIGLRDVMAPYLTGRQREFGVRAALVQRR